MSETNDTIESGGSSIGASGISIALWVPTANLRWSKEGKLQHAWENIYHPSNDGRYEWCDIPMEQE